MANETWKFVQAKSKYKVPSAFSFSFSFSLQPSYLQLI